MKIYTLAAALAICTFGVSFAATTTDANLSLKLSYSGTANDGDVVTVGPVKSQISFTHSINTSGVELDAFGENTIIKISGILSPGLMDFTLGDDPNYQVGDTSAKVTNTGVVVSGETLGDASAQLDWSSGDLVINVKAKLYGNLENPFPVLRAKKATAVSGILKTNKDADPSNVTTDVENPGPVTVFSTVAALICDTRQKVDEFQAAEGNAATKISISIKSQFLD